MITTGRPWPESTEDHKKAEYLRGFLLGKILSDIPDGCWGQTAIEMGTRLRPIIKIMRDCSGKLCLNNGHFMGFPAIWKPGSYHIRFVAYHQGQLA